MTDEIYKLAAVVDADGTVLRLLAVKVNEDGSTDHEHVEGDVVVIPDGQLPPAPGGTYKDGVFKAAWADQPPPPAADPELETPPSS